MSRNLPNVFFASALVLGITFGMTAAAQLAQPTGAARPAGGAGLGFAHPAAEDWNDHEGWQQIFDGKTLNGWDGIPGHWSVEDGAIVGTSTDENPAGTTNLIWRGGQPANFRLRFEVKMEGSGANGGFQYRGKNDPLPVRTMDSARMAAMTPEMKARIEKSQELNQKNAKWSMWGYQADFDAGNRYTGQLYDAGTGRNILAWRGDAVAAEPGGKIVKIGSLGNYEDLKAYIKPLGEWNQMEVIADGNTMTHILNGHVMAIVVDTDPKNFSPKGLIAFELEGPGNVKISHRNIWLKQLP
jgi:hypothetical protein